MTGTLSKFEAQLQRIIEEGTARLFSSRDLKSELASNLIESMQMEVQFGEGGVLVAPGIYTIHASREHALALKSNLSLMAELKAALLKAAAESGVQLSTEPVLRVTPQDDLAAGEFRVRCAELAENLSQTQTLPPLPPQAKPQLPAGAFLIVSGTQIFPLDLPIVTIGRKKDNTLVLDSPAVSRRHAQLRAIDGHYHFFDLGSTGGSKINGTEAKEAVLLAGDVITLAGIPLIYGQDGEAQNSVVTQEFHPGTNSSGK